VDRFPERVCGAGHTALILILVGAMATGLLAAWLLQGGRASDPTVPAGAHAIQPPPDAPGPISSAPGTRQSAHSERSTPPAGPAGEDPARSRRHDGTGRIRGYVETDPDLPMPTRWTLVLGPSPFLAGRERALPRRLEVEGGEREFNLPDLPLAGYRLLVEAPGVNCTPLDVQLDRDNNDLYVILALARAGFIAGQVLDEAGAAVEELEVWLEPRPGSERVKSLTDHLGGFCFESVRDGEYVLYLGPPSSPLLAPQQLVFRAPSLTLSAQVIPVLGRLELVVVDEFGSPVQDAELRGSGNAGGLVNARSDPSGRALVRFLPPGRYRVHARHEDFGTALKIVSLRVGEAPEVRLELTR